MLTAEIIDKKSDQDLIPFVFYFLSKKLPIDLEKEQEVVNSWNKFQQAVYIIWLFDYEVCNGGFYQFCTNRSVIFYPVMTDLMEFVGATKHADIVKRSFNLFAGNVKLIFTRKNDPDYEKNRTNSIALFEELNNEFYKLNETNSLEQILTRFIRNNKLEFIDK